MSRYLGTKKIKKCISWDIIVYLMNANRLYIVANINKIYSKLTKGNCYSWMSKLLIMLSYSKCTCT